ncbi:hypothetical protein N9N03_02790 [Chlamydiia bacterium]|nr:hypothetical protein [Chlamydiia bacterium]
MYYQALKSVTLGFILTSITHTSALHLISTEIFPIIEDDILISKTIYDETINNVYMTDGSKTNHVSLSILNDTINKDMDTSIELVYQSSMVDVDALMIMNDTDETLDASVASINVIADILKARGAILLNDDFDAVDLSAHFDYNSILLTLLKRNITSDNGDKDTQIASLGYRLTDAIIVDLNYMTSDFEDTAPNTTGNLVDKTSTGFGISYEGNINDVTSILAGYKQAATEYTDDDDSVDEEDEYKLYLVGNTTINSIDSTVALSRTIIEDEASILADIHVSYPITDTLDIIAVALLSEVGDDRSATVYQISAAYEINPSFVIIATQRMGENDDRGTETDIEETDIQIKRNY